MGISRVSIPLFIASILAGGCEDAEYESATPRQYPPQELCDVISEVPDECVPPSDTCPQVCGATSCDTPCTLNQEAVTCAEYGDCLEPCTQSLCEWDPGCQTLCLHNGSAKTCGGAGMCLPKPDCLIEFWTDAGYTGTRACYGTSADIDQAIASGGSATLTVNQVAHNDKYSSFRTIEEICALRGDTECYLQGTSREVRVGDVTVYQHANLKGAWRRFLADVESTANFYGMSFTPILKLNDMISSFTLQYTVAPACFRVVGAGCNFCLDGMGWAGAIDCSVVATPLSSAGGWVQVDAAQNVWAWFDQDSQAPLQLYESSPGVFAWGLHKDFRIVYPGEFYTIEWRYGASKPTIFQPHIPGAF